MFQDDKPASAEKATPCARCGDRAEIEVWGHELCRFCHGLWLKLPMQAHEVPREGESPLEHFARVVQMLAEERYAGWRRLTRDFVAAGPKVRRLG